MKIMHCPMNGPRNISEFVYGGEVKTMPNSRTCSDQEWAEYIFYHDNKAGIVQEWWMHSASAYWFIAERNTVTDEVSRAFDPCELFKEKMEFQVPESSVKND